MELNRNRPDRPHQSGKKRHFKDGFDLWIKKERIGELRKLLKGWDLKAEKDYIFSVKSTYDFDRMKSFGGVICMEAVISFKSSDKATLFKLSWAECEPTRSDRVRYLNKVVLPVIRRVMPSIIAHDIIGVQPMTTPAAQVHSLKVKYGTGTPQPQPPPQSQSKSKLEKMLDDAREELKKAAGATSSSPNHSFSLIRPDETE